MTKFAVVCTTIGDGSFLKHYARALEGADARMIVIPDRKTPKAIYEAYDTYSWDGVIACPSPAEQTAWLEKLGAPADFFPWDTDHRRNIGYLMAYESGADVVISIDDDNLPVNDRWLKDHAWVIAPEIERPVMSRDGDPWFWNPFRIEKPYPSERVWPRGFPYKHRTGWSDGLITEHRCVLAINQGLWRGEPDVDAITRLAIHPKCDFAPDCALALGPDAWAPVNSQNTAIRREVIPAYYFFRSGRFGDIYQGYLAQACAKAIGHSVRFGTPVVTHARNDHDLLADLQLELPDIRILDGWLDWLTGLSFAGGSYAGNYEYLAAELREHAESGESDADAKKTFRSMASQMHEWLALIRKIGA